MPDLIKKRQSLHRRLREQGKQTDRLISQVSRMQSLVNIGTVSCMIAHEINNILTPLANYAQLALENQQDTELTAKALRKTVKNCERARKIQESMLALADGREQEKKSCQLKILIEEIFSGMCRDFSKDRIRVDVKVAEDFVILAVPVQIQQVLMNLIINARDAMAPGGGSLKIEAGRTDETRWVEVSDTGCGIKPENIGRIFEPFFRTKNDDSASGRTGDGIGLAFCKEIVDAHDGHILVRSDIGKGTSFKIVLPRNDK